MSRNFGFIESVIDAKTPKYTFKGSLDFPEKYSYMKFLPPVEDQGENPYCVPYSIGTWLNYKKNLKTGEKKNNQITYKDIFKARTTEDENGMTFKDAFKYLQKNGVKSKAGKLKVSTAGYVPSIQMVKSALVINGPCVGALPVYTTEHEDFWNKEYGSLQGFHAVAIVGYDENGLIIRNSWGAGYGKNGYGHITYADANKFKEIWTIMS